jgi:precorrin-6Y C5,15-methyltransferase (decarboxylating)
VITVVGLGASPPAEVRALVERAALVVGAERHLAGLPAARALPLSGDLAAALDAATACEGDVVVLASGDPGFFGIARALAARVGRESLRVLPGVSSVAAAFARAGIPWDDALVVSAHGRDPAPAINACRAHPKVAVLTGPGFGPGEIARALVGLGRRILVAERLGEADERIVEGTAEEIAAGEWRDPNVVVVFDDARVAGPRGWAWPPRQVPRRWALPEEEFERAGDMVTKAEVRALALARLGPGLGDLVWDVGAGTGSVAIECARFGAAAVAVERDPERCRRIARNAERHGVAVEVRCGEAPEALEPLPDPDCAYVGGTGGRLPEVLALVAARVRRAAVVALAGLERVRPAGRALAEGGLAVEVTLVQAARLRAIGGASRLAPTNPVFLVAGVRGPTIEGAGGREGIPR